MELIELSLILSRQSFNNLVMEKFKSVITGNLDVFVIEQEDELNGEKVAWNQVLIHGDPEGLRSLANLLLKLADLDQNSVDTLPNDAREHIHLHPKFDLSNSSDAVIVGRLDAKGTGAFYDRYIPRLG